MGDSKFITDSTNIVHLCTVAATQYKHNKSGAAAKRLQIKYDNVLWQADDWMPRDEMPCTPNALEALSEVYHYVHKDILVIPISSEDGNLWAIYSRKSRN